VRRRNILIASRSANSQDGRRRAGFALSSLRLGSRGALRCGWLQSDYGWPRA